MADSNMIVLENPCLELESGPSLGSPHSKNATLKDLTFCKENQVTYVHRLGAHAAGPWLHCIICDDPATSLSLASRCADVTMESYHVIITWAASLPNYLVIDYSRSPKTCIHLSHVSFLQCHQQCLKVQAVTRQSLNVK